MQNDNCKTQKKYIKASMQFENANKYFSNAGKISIKSGALKKAYNIQMKKTCKLM